MDFQSGHASPTVNTGSILKDLVRSPCIESRVIRTVSLQLQVTLQGPRFEGRVPSQTEGCVPSNKLNATFSQKIEDRISSPLRTAFSQRMEERVSSMAKGCIPSSTQSRVSPTLQGRISLTIHDCILPITQCCLSFSLTTQSRVSHTTQSRVSTNS